MIVTFENIAQNNVAIGKYTYCKALFSRLTVKNFSPGT